jgi:twitching motility protein PilT
MSTLRMSGIKKILDGVTTPEEIMRVTMSDLKVNRRDEPAERSSKSTCTSFSRTMVEKGASDMHITTGSPPLLRIDGSIVPLKLPPLGPVETKQLCLLDPERGAASQFEKHNELDLSFGVKGLSRFRANIFMQRGAVAGAFRTIPFKILTFDELGLPPVVAELREQAERTGARDGSDRLRQVDDARGDDRQDQLRAALPHHHGRGPDRVPAPAQALGRQPARGGADTEGFKQALKYVLRQDPDVVLVGEMRDLETIEAALTISETGHLVFATLHTNSAISTINRIIDVFPPHQQPQIRAKLSFVLQGVISQQLLPRHNAPGRVLALEVLVPNQAIRNLIREDKVHQIYSQMQVGQDKYAMQTLNQSLFSLSGGGADRGRASARRR